MNLNSRFIGIVYGLASSLCFAVMNTLIRVYAHDFPPGEIMFARGLCSIVFLTPCIAREIPSLFMIKSLFLWTRCLAGAIAIFALFYNIQLSGAAVSTALSYLASVFVIVLSTIFLRERLSRREWMGIIIVLSASVVLHLPIKSVAGSLTLFIGLLGAFAGGVAMTALKQTTGQEIGSYPQYF